MLQSHLPSPSSLSNVETAMTTRDKSGLEDGVQCLLRHAKVGIELGCSPEAHLWCIMRYIVTCRLPDAQAHVSLPSHDVKHAVGDVLLLYELPSHVVLVLSLRLRL